MFPFPVFCVVFLRPNINGCQKGAFKTPLFPEKRFIRGTPNSSPEAGPEAAVNPVRSESRKEGAKEGNS